MNTDTTLVPNAAGTAAPAPTARPQRVYAPVVDILDEPEQVVLFADLPGVAIGDVDLRVEEGVLTLSAPRATTPPEGYRLVRAELGSGEYRRQFALARDIDTERIEASLKNGVLRVVVPKLRASQHKIEIRGE